MRGSIGDIGFRILYGVIWSSVELDEPIQGYLGLYRVVLAYVICRVI